MTKQEFLAMSLPYGLKCQFLNSTYDYTPMKYVFEFINNGEKSTPILRPLSMLTEPCLPDGEIPIVELAKISWIKDENPEFKIQKLVEETVFIAFTDKETVFGYDSNTKSFFGALYGKPISVVNQIMLFQKLIEWHFDIVELLKKGEAIAVTEDFNPYK